MKSTRADVATVKATVNTAVQGFEGQLVSLSDTTRHGLQDVSQNTEPGIHALLGGPQDVITTVVTREDQISKQVMISDPTSAMRHANVTAALAQVSAAANDRIDAVDKGLSSVHQGQGRLLRQQDSSTVQIINNIQSASNALSREMASLALSEQDNHLVFESVKLEVLTTPLTLMRRKLVRVIETLVRESKMSLSLAETFWVKSQQDSLLAAS